MTKEGKQLLLKDLCARLPYGVKVDYPCWRNRPLNAITDIKLNKTVSDELILIPTDICMSMNNASYKYGNPLPYLRPMSSMTEEERKEYKHLVAFSGNSYGAADLVDWLNKKMFAYRTIDGKDMFELGLALEAPKGMYKI